MASLSFNGSWFRFCGDNEETVLNAIASSTRGRSVARNPRVCHVIQLSEVEEICSVREINDPLDSTSVFSFSAALPRSHRINSVSFNYTCWYDEENRNLICRKVSEDGTIIISESRRLYQGMMELSTLVTTKSAQVCQSITWFSLESFQEDGSADSSCFPGSTKPVFDLKAPVTPKDSVNPQSMLESLSSVVYLCQYVLEYQHLVGSTWQPTVQDEVIYTSGEQLVSPPPWAISAKGCQENPLEESVSRLRAAHQYNLTLPNDYSILREFAVVVDETANPLGWTVVAINKGIVTRVDSSRSSLVVGQIRGRLWCRILVPAVDLSAADDMARKCFRSPRIANRVLCRGQLWKRGKVNTSWKKRMFVLRGQQLLYYAIDGTVPVLRGHFDLIGCSLQTLPPSDCFGHEFGLKITLASGEARYLAATDEANRERWLDMISQYLTLRNLGGKPSPEVFPLTANKVLKEGDLFIEGRERNDWVQHRFVLTNASLKYSNTKGQVEGLMDLQCCVFTESAESECEFSLQSTMPGDAARGLEAIEGRNVLRVLAASASLKAEWRDALRIQLKKHCSNFEWSTFADTAQQDLSSRSAASAASALFTDFAIESEEITSVSDDNHSYISRTSASSTNSTTNKAKSSAGAALSRLFRSKKSKSKRQLEEGGEEGGDSEVASPSVDEEEQDVSKTLSRSKSIGNTSLFAGPPRPLIASASASALVPSPSDDDPSSASDPASASASTSLSSPTRAPSAKARASTASMAVPEDLAALFRNQHIDGTNVFKGVWTLKKFEGDIVYRKRFVWIDPVDRTIHWAKSDEDVSSKFIYLPTASLSVKSPIGQSQCFGVKGEGVSIRIQLPTPESDAKRKSKKKLAEYDSSVDASIWVRLIHILRTSPP